MPETSLVPITLLLAVAVATVLLAVLPSRSSRRCALKAAFCRILD